MKKHQQMQAEDADSYWTVDMNQVPNGEQDGCTLFADFLCCVLTYVLVFYNTYFVEKTFLRTLFHSRKQGFGLLYCWELLEYEFQAANQECGLSPFFSEANVPVMENRHFTGETILCSGGGNFHSSHWYRFKREMEYLTHRLTHGWLTPLCC